MRDLSNQGRFSVPILGSQPRLGRSLLHVYQQAPAIKGPVVHARMGALIAAGQAVDFAVRLRGHGAALSASMALEFGAQVGLASFRLVSETLPRLKAADVVDYRLDLVSGELLGIEEYVGLTGRVIDQAMRVLDQYGPSDVELALLHSAEVGSWSPLTETNHKDQLSRRGFTPQVVDDAVQLTLASGVNSFVRSVELNERVIFNPNVWAAHNAGVAGFLASLPSAERDSLLAMCAQAAERPGLTLGNYSQFSQGVLQSARKVGLVQAATVRSSIPGAAPQTYLFSPMQESADDRLQSTEALHQRKLFVAHMLYGHDRAVRARGRILDPTILVDRLLSRGRVGPASNIATDYHLLEAQGIIAVRSSGIPGRAYLDVVKKDVVSSGLTWLQATFDQSAGHSGAEPGDLRPPDGWQTPEVDRAVIADEGEAVEITTAAVLRLRAAREEAERAARFDF